MKFQPILKSHADWLVNKKIINNNNFHHLEPYQVDSNRIMINKSWFNQQPSFIKSDIYQILSDFNIDFVDNIVIKDNILAEYYEWHNMEINIYWKFTDGYDYEKWIKYMDQKIYKYELLEILQPIKNILAQKYLCRQLSDEEDNLLHGFINKISNILNKIGSNTGYFVKLGSSSAKQSHILKPLKNSSEIMNFLNNRQFMETEYQMQKTTFLVIMPWKIDIRKKYEFRVFVYNRRVTAISQQFWNKCFNYNITKIKSIGFLILNSNIWKILPYNSLVADVYYANGEIHLIECNPFGAFSPSRSALFGWIVDHNILYGNCDPEFRYII